MHGRCKNITVINHSAFNCSDAFHISHNPDYRAADAGNTTITGITLGNPTVITVAGNTFTGGEHVFTYSVGGTTQLNPTYSNWPSYEVLASSGNQITIDLDSSAFDAWTSGGNVVRADMTDGGRSPSVRVFGMHAEECEYSLINVEAANYPRTITPFQTAYFSGVTAKNCGTTSTRGLINGDNACGIQIDGLTAVNDADHPVKSILRGSFQDARITGTFDIHTVTGSVIDADPWSENPSGTGIDAGIGSHPFGTSLDNTYDLKYIARGTPAPTLIHATDLAGTSIDRFYRNEIRITVSGQADGERYIGTINDIALHLSNRARVFDQSNGHVFEGPLTTAGIVLNSGNSEREFGGVNYFMDTLGVKDNGGGFASFRARDTANLVKGEWRYTTADNRWRAYMNGTQYWQITAANILPNVDNGYDFASASLRGRTAYFGTGTINTSDAREKLWRGQLTDPEVRVAIRLSKLMGIYQWKSAIEEKEDGARFHIGVTSQAVRDAFDAEGLDGFRYGVLCYDQWADEYENVLDQNGRPTGGVILVLKAGDRYSLRYDELSIWIACGFEARLAAIEHDPS